MVSVIIPTKDRPEYLPLALRSALSQTFSDIEVIVVDDGTTHNAEVVVRHFGDPRIIYTRNSRTPGSSGARNTGIDLARGEFIAFLDDDDEYLPTKLEQQLRRFAEVTERVGLVDCGASFIDSDTGNEMWRHVPRHRGNLYYQLLDKVTGPRTPCAMIRSSCIDQCGAFDEGLAFAEETDLWIRLAAHYDFDFVADCLVSVRRTHPNKLTRDDRAQIAGLERLLLKYGEALSRDFRAGVAARMGNAHCHLGNRREGRRHLAEAIRLRPHETTTYVYWASSWLPGWLYRRLRRLKSRLSVLLRPGW